MRGWMVVGAEDAGGVRIEGDGEGLAAEEAGAGDDFGDDALVAEMHAVEVADGGDYGGVRGGEVGELGVGEQGSGQWCKWFVVKAQMRGNLSLDFAQG